MAGASRKIEMDKKVCDWDSISGVSSWSTSLLFIQVIQAGKYDNKSTAEERDEYLASYYILSFTLDHEQD